MTARTKVGEEILSEVTNILEQVKSGGIKAEFQSVEMESGVYTGAMVNRVTLRLPNGERLMLWHYLK